MREEELQRLLSRASPMKRLLAPILLLTLLFPAFAIGETMDDLVERGGIHYKKFSDARKSSLQMRYCEQ